MHAFVSLFVEIPVSQVLFHHCLFLDLLPHMFLAFVCLPAVNKSFFGFASAACTLTWQEENTNNSDMLDFSSKCHGAS